MMKREEMIALLKSLADEPVRHYRGKYKALIDMGIIMGNTITYDYSRDTEALRFAVKVLEKIE
mgnify:CR=1 FL=1